MTVSRILTLYSSSLTRNSFSTSTLCLFVCNSVIHMYNVDFPFDISGENYSVSCWDDFKNNPNSSEMFTYRIDKSIQTNVCCSLRV